MIILTASTVLHQHGVEQVLVLPLNPTDLGCMGPFEIK